MRRLAHGLLGELAAALRLHPRELFVFQKPGVAQGLDQMPLDLADFQTRR